jgi:hypothetical protein
MIMCCEILEEESSILRAPISPNKTKNCHALIYLGLGLNPVNYARWSLNNIEENEYFTQGVDFVDLFVKKSSFSEPNCPKDFAISID